MVFFTIQALMKVLLVTKRNKEYLATKALETYRPQYRGHILGWLIK